MIAPTMRAARLHGPGDALRIETVPVPAPGPGEILIRLEACGVCHTDVHIREAGHGSVGAPQPLILGHEGIGRVAVLGPEVAAFRIGELAGISWLHSTCGTCDPCLSGRESFCQTQKAHGYDVHGGFADYVIVPETFAVRLAEGLDPVATAPLLCAGITAFGAVRQAGLRLGERCAIFGCGGLGLYAVQLARRAGAEVVAIDVSPAKLDRARALGAHHIILADEATGAALRALGGMHACINFAPTQRSWAAMIEGVRPLGRIIAAAMVGEPVPIRQDWLATTGVTITGTSVGTRLEMAELLRLHAAEPLESDAAATTLGQLNEALDDLAAGRVAGRRVVRL